MANRKLSKNYIQIYGEILLRVKKSMKKVYYFSFTVKMAIFFYVYDNSFHLFFGEFGAFLQSRYPFPDFLFLMRKDFRYYP
jgi:hypothetical protein